MQIDGDTNHFEVGLLFLFCISASLFSLTHSLFFSLPVHNNSPSLRIVCVSRPPPKTNNIAARCLSLHVIPWRCVHVYIIYIDVRQRINLNMIWHQKREIIYIFFSLLSVVYISSPLYCRVTFSCVHTNY